MFGRVCKCAEAGLKLRHLISPAVCEVFPQQQVELCSNGHDGRHKTTQPWQQMKPTTKNNTLLFHNANTKAYLPTLSQGSSNLILKGQCPAEFSSNLPQHTCLAVSSIPSKGTSKKIEYGEKSFFCNLFPNMKLSYILD